MDGKINEGDAKILTALADFGPLISAQLSAITQRSPQVVRRRLRALRSGGLIDTRMRGYGRGPGRPEDIVFLTDAGEKALKDEGLLQSEHEIRSFENISPVLLDHELLISWFRIHLNQIQNTFPQLSVKFLRGKSKKEIEAEGGSFSLHEWVPCAGSDDDRIGFVPDGVFCISSEDLNKTLLFYLEVDMGTESVASPDGKANDLRQKILNYQSLFSIRGYKRYEEVFNAPLNGFRLLILTNSPKRLTSLCRLIQEMPPSDFVWLAEHEMMFNQGLSSNIWARGGGLDKPRQSILGATLSCDCPILPALN